MMMFRSIGKPSNDKRSRHVTSMGKDGTAVEEDYGDGESSSNSKGAVENPEHHWPRVRLPTDDLDQLMWGSSGVPPAAPSELEPSKYQKNWAASSTEKSEATSEKVDSEECGGVADNNIAETENDNILSALEIAGKGQMPPPPPPPVPDKILLEDIVWKQRSGFGKYSFGFLQHEWEQRRVVLYESGILRYYSLQKNMEGVKYDPSHAVDPDKSPWVYDPNQEPRGEMDLKVRGGYLDGSGGAVSPTSLEKGMRRLTSFVHSSENGTNAGGATVQARKRRGDPGPTPFEIDIKKKDDSVMWRFCFLSQSIQIEWLSLLKTMASDYDEGDGSDDAIHVASEGLEKHGFQPGDHIIRWEMLPVLYPIQIHGIVLETGKNCVIIADFGLASYDNHRAAGDLTTWSGDEGKDDSHDVIMAAWEKIKPKEKKRLNVIAVTDPREIRKWSKINYGDQVEKKDKKNGGGGFFTSFLPVKSKHKVKKNEEATIIESDDDSKKGDAAKYVECAESESSASKETTGVAQDDVNDGNPDDDESNKVEGEPEWARPGYKPWKRVGSSSSSSSTPVTNNGQSVFSIDRPEDNHAKSELPKSDSAKLVLARTHFILEHEDLLPPYHVFYSNSECIAVWCKTGRWSTLQAAVYLVSSSVGFGKSATMFTLSVAAAHMILVPALAVGGLAVVGAPLLLLKMSQEKWEKATIHLTEKFWMHAEPEVFVEAIEYWANWGKH